MSHQAAAVQTILDDVQGLQGAIADAFPGCTIPACWGPWRRRSSPAERTRVWRLEREQGAMILPGQTVLQRAAWRWPE